MAGEISLMDVPDDFSQSFLNNKPTLRQKQRAVAFVKDAYIKSVKIFRGENENSIQITAKIFRSQRKSEDPHRVNLDVKYHREELQRCTLQLQNWVCKLFVSKFIFWLLTCSDVFVQCCCLNLIQFLVTFSFSS